MSFSIRTKYSASKELERIAKSNRARIVEGINRLADNPFLSITLKGELRVCDNFRSAITSTLRGAGRCAPYTSHPNRPPAGRASLENNSMNRFDHST